MDAPQNELHFQVSAIEFDKVYRVMDRRKALGFSDKELSFLLGYHAMHVRDAENPLDTPRYPPKDTNYLLQIMDCSLKQIMASKLKEKFYHLIVTEKEGSVGYPIYEIHLDRGGQKPILYRQFSTADPPIIIKSIADPDQVQQYINHLFSKDYFSAPRTALEIYQKCLRKFGKPLQPAFVADALAYHTAKRKMPKLIREKNLSNRTVYQKQV